MIKVRPFLKWAGNKFNCLHHFLALLPPADRLIEPFTGSGAVFMNTQYDDYILAEQNKDLIDLYLCLQKNGPAFIDYCKTFFVEQNNNSESYYYFREQFNQTPASDLRVALFLYLNRHGYNGLCRYNSKGIYNVPFGRYKKPYFPMNEMNLFHQKSQNMTFVHNDFRQTFLMVKAGDVVYCDPPYAPLKQKSNFSAYIGQPFAEEEQCALTQCALEAANRGVTVVISNHDTDFTRAQYAQAEIKSFEVSRVINCHIDHRVPVRELLAIFRP